MLSDNIKVFRKNRGLTQEELAIRVNVVRQTVSKWEKGLSVPDAELLQRVAEVLEVSVSDLLGVGEISVQEKNEVAEQLSRINEQLAIKNRRSRKLWKAVAYAIGAFVILELLIMLLSYAPAGNDPASPYVEITASEYAEIIATQTTE